MNASRFTTSPIMHTISGKAQPTPLCLVDHSAMSAAIGQLPLPDLRLNLRDGGTRWAA